MMRGDNAMMPERNDPHAAPQGPSEGQPHVPARGPRSPLEGRQSPGTLRAGEIAAARQRASEAQQRAMGDLRDSIDYLRVSVKSLVHDLEATRREKAALERQLRDLRGW